MAFYSLTMLQMARTWPSEDDSWTDIEVKFIEHFVLIVEAMHSQGLWDEEDGFFYDLFHAADGRSELDQGPVDRRGAAPDRRGRPGPRTAGDSREHSRSASRDSSGMTSWRSGPAAGGSSPPRQATPLAVGVIPPGEVGRVLARVFDEGEFLSPHGLRALSKWHEEHPLSVEIGGIGGLGGV